MHIILLLDYLILQNNNLIGIHLLLHPKIVLIRRIVIGIL